MSRPDPSKQRHFHDIVGEFVSALNMEFGTEIDPAEYRWQERDNAARVSDVYDWVTTYAQEFLMGELQRALPRKSYCANADLVVDVVDQIADEFVVLEQERYKESGKNPDSVNKDDIHKRVSDTLVRAQELLRGSPGAGFSRG